jgi:hypothetical protein
MPLICRSVWPILYSSSDVRIDIARGMEGHIPVSDGPWASFHWDGFRRCHRDPGPLLRLPFVSI